MSQTNKILLLDPDELHTHEEVDEGRVRRLIAKFEESGVFDLPLLVDIRSKVVLDGHHRLWASRRLGLKRIPCYVVDYLNDDSVRVESWRPDVTVTKEEVVRMGLGSETFPLKTTRHIYELPGEFEPVPLEELSRDA